MAHTSNMGIEKDIAKILDADVLHMSPLSGGCVGSVYAVSLSDGRRCVVKTDEIGGKLHIEGKMLTYLKEHSSLVVPTVWYAEGGLLVMDMLNNDGRLNDISQIQAADQIATLHAIKSDRFGLGFDTLIGGLHQPNTQTSDWFDFYRDQRLFYMADQAIQAGNMPVVFMSRLEKLGHKLLSLVPQPDRASLLHGDLWAGNVLVYKGNLTGFIDPAIYYGHPEMDLAFSTLFNTFGDVFFSRYQEHHKIENGFFEDRRDLYNMYPLLVHVRLFGGTYVADVDRILTKFGC